jgi:hypothetical protein
LESFRFIAAHSPDLEGLELERVQRMKVRITEFAATPPGLKEKGGLGQPPL